MAKYCPYCGESFNIFQRFFNYDDDHIYGCAQRDAREKDLALRNKMVDKGIAPAPARPVVAPAPVVRPAASVVVAPAVVAAPVVMIDPYPVYEEVVYEPDIVISAPALVDYVESCVEEVYVDAGAYEYDCPTTSDYDYSSDSTDYDDRDDY